MEFNDFGLLPPNDHELTLEELKNSILVKGPSDDEIWDTSWRSYLVDRLEILAKQLWAVGITEIFINGSFVDVHSQTA